MSQNPLNLHHHTKEDDAMINTNDLKTLNSNLDFDVRICEVADLGKNAKSVWFIQLYLRHKDKEQELYTFAGHRRYFKTLDFCLNFVLEFCDNAKNIYIICDNKTIQVLDKPLSKPKK